MTAPTVPPYRHGTHTSGPRREIAYPCAAVRRQKVTYRWLPHTADVRAALEAPTFPALLDDVVDLLRELCAGAGASVLPTLEQPVTARGADPADLLLQFAREVHAAFALQTLVPARFQLADLSLTPGRAAALSGRLLGEPFDPSRHETQPEVKAVTRHGLLVRRDEHGWHAELLFDV